MEREAFGLGLGWSTAGGSLHLPDDVRGAGRCFFAADGVAEGPFTGGGGDGEGVEGEVVLSLGVVDLVGERHGVVVDFVVVVFADLDLLAGAFECGGLGLGGGGGVYGAGAGTHGGRDAVGGGRIVGGGFAERHCGSGGRRVGA